MSTRRPRTLPLLLALLVTACGDRGGPGGLVEVGSVAVSAPAASVEVGETLRLTAVVRDASGAVLDGRAVAWESSDSAVASVTADGVLLGRRVGAVVVSASSEGRSGERGVTVTQRAIARIDLTPAWRTVRAGHVLQLVATPRDAGGAPLAARALAWESSDTLVARVTGAGAVAGVAPGPATVTVRGEGVVAEARVAVIAPGDGGGWIAVSAGGHITCAISTSALAYCWGRNAHGQLGTGSSDLLDHAAPEVVGGPQFAAVSTGGYHSCGIAVGGEAYCWGHERGQLGGGGEVDGCGSSGEAPCRVHPSEVRGGHRFRALGAGLFHTCGVTTRDVALCWGWNDLGQLGTTETVEGCPFRPCSTVPRPVEGELSFVAVSAGGADHTCAIAADGAAYCWGSNGLGELGGGQPETFCNQAPCSPRPLRVAGGIRFATVAIGLQSCGLSVDGAAYCWGSNQYGQLGTGAPTEARLSRVPSAVVGDLRFSAITTGAYHSCAIALDGLAYCWGDNREGQLGIGRRDGEVSWAPRPVAGTRRFASISAGWFHTCGVTLTGALYCWGGNNFGEVGAPPGTASTAPVRVADRP